MTNPLGHSIHLTYDRRDNVLTFTDANGQVTRRQYDGNGNLTRQINALNQETRYEYEGGNRLIRVIDAKNQVTQLGYDAKGRLISLTNPLGYTQTLEYDAADNLLKRFDALGKTVISLNYDELNNPTRVTDALANHTFFDYDELSQLTQTTDPLAVGTQFRYDDLNRLIASVDALTGVSSQNFDADGNRENLTDPSSNPTQFDFDLSGRLVQETVATGNQVKYRYNASNLLTQITNARGQSRQLEYDATGRVTHFTDIDGTVSFTYDNNGNVLTVSDSQGTITRTYDALNRVASYTEVNGNLLHYEYDEVGNLVALTYPDGKLVHYEYDANDQLVKVTDWAGRITQYQYDANGRLIKTLRPNGTVQTRQYDVKGQLLAQTDLDAQGNSLVAYIFSYDAAGNLVQEQVIPEWLPVLPTSVKMTYTAANRLATYNGQAVQFDADGNLLTVPLNGQMSPLQFDSRNRLVQAGNTSYRCDAENQRVGVNQTSYVINSQPALSQVLVKEENGIKTFYVYGLGLIGDETSGQYRSYHFDYRGSTVALTDGSGQVIQRFQYAPYGELVSGETTQTPFLFNGLYGVMTDESGLYYMRARYYSPAIKRFVNQDILLGNVAEGQTLNRFAFVTGQPVSLVDPFGLEIISPELYENDAAYLKEKQVFNESTIILISLIPGVGETLDLDVLLGISGPSSEWDKLGAGSSLVLSVFTGTLAPNYGALARCEKFYNQYPADEIAVAMSKVIPNKMLKQVNGTFNYVVTTDGKLIVGKSFSVPGGGHIDLANGQPVLAAGELKVVNGELKYIDNASGHYQPIGDSPRLVIEEILKDLGFDTTGKYLNKVWVPDPTLPRGGAWKPVK